MARVDEKRFEDATAKLLTAFPKDHPVAHEVYLVMQAMWVEVGSTDVALQGVTVAAREAKEIIDIHALLVDVLQDWRRGIRDWDEVEEALKDVEAALEERTETGDDE